MSASLRGTFPADPDGIRTIEPRVALRGWRGYAFALVVTAATYLARIAIAPLVGPAPFLMVFLVPVLLSAYFGRIGPGFTALGASAAALLYAHAIPGDPLATETPAFRSGLTVLIVNGALVCIVSEALHRAHDRMRAAAVVFRTTLASIGDAVIASDMRRRVTFMNAEAARLTGWLPADAVGRPLDEVFRVINDRRDGLVEQPVEAALISQSRQSYSQDVWVVSRDGLETPIEDRSAPIRGHDAETPHGVVVVFRDASFRRAALGALSRSELLNRAVLDSLAAHVAVLDRHGCIIATNEAWRRFAIENASEPGVAPPQTGIGANYLVAAAAADARHPETGIAVADGIRAVIERKLPRFSIEYPCHGPGEDRWFTMTVTPLELDNLGAVVSHHDITSRKLAEAALAESEVRNRTLLENLADGVLVAQGYCFVYANPALERMLDYGPGQFAGAPFARVIDPADLGGVTERYRLRTGDGPEPDRVQHVRFMRRDGSRLWVEAHLSRVLFRGSPAVLGIIRDETERRSAQEAVRMSNAKLQAALAAGEMGVWTFDLVSDELAWDEFTAAHFKLPFPDRRACLGDFVELVHPQDRGAIDAALAAVRGNAASVGDEFRVLVEGQDMRWVSFTARPERDADGTPVRVVGVCSDITRRKESEEHARRMHKLEALGTLAGGIAHDFNNLLAAILGNARLLEADLPPGHGAGESVDAIVNASRRGADLVRQILTFSRATEERLQPVALASVVADAVRLLRATVPAMIDIVEHHDADVPAVAGDSGQLHQVVVNLVTNAAHAMPAGGAGTIDVYTQRVSVGDALARSIDGLQADTYVRLRVRDTGAGMAPEVAKRIFDPFFTTKPLGEGTGLGLAVVHGIVGRHHGAIAVASARGHGTTIDVYLPLATRTDETPLTAAAPVAEPAAEPRQAPPAASRARGEHILFVDDEEDLVALAQRTLERAGYRVTAFGDAGAALAELHRRSGDFDLLITDLSMPRMTGFDLARQALALRPDLPVVVMSGYVRPEDEATARGIGVLDVLNKPATVDAFGDVVDGVFAALDAPRAGGHEGER